MDVKKIQEKVSELSNYKGFSSTDFAKNALGKPTRQAYYDFFKRKYINEDEIYPIAKYFNLSVEDFLKENNNTGVPIYNIHFQAGTFYDFNDIKERIIGYINDSQFRKCVAFVFSKGKSMLPIIGENQMLGLEPVDFNADKVMYGEIHAVVTNDQLRVVKTLKKGASNDTLLLYSENREFEDIKIAIKDVFKLYIVRFL